MMTLTQEFFGTADPEHQREDVEALKPGGDGPTVRGGVPGLLRLLRRRWSKTVAPILATTSPPIVAIAKGADGEYLPKSFAYGYYMAIATAGHDTTSATLAGTLQLLSQHPDVLARVKADPKLIPNLILEALRIVAPVKHFIAPRGAGLHDARADHQEGRPADAALPVGQPRRGRLRPTRMSSTSTASPTGRSHSATARTCASASTCPSSN